MKYLSIDIEATGLNQNDYIIEFGMIPFDTESRMVNENLARNYFISCPSFEELRPKLDQWVIDHNEGLIRKAHKEGIPLSNFKQEMQAYLTDKKVTDYFQNQGDSGHKNKAVMLFGKSLNAIDLPFLTRDLGFDFMRKHFHHRVLDLSSSASTLVDMQMLPSVCNSGSGLMKFLGMGDVAHTALEDAKNTALMYLKLIDRFAPK